MWSHSSLLFISVFVRKKIEKKRSSQTWFHSLFPFSLCSRLEKKIEKKDVPRRSLILSFLPSFETRFHPLFPSASFSFSLFPLFLNSKTNNKRNSQTWSDSRVSSRLCSTLRCTPYKLGIIGPRTDTSPLLPHGRPPPYPLDFKHSQIPFFSSYHAFTRTYIIRQIAAGIPSLVSTCKTSGKQRRRSSQSLVDMEGAANKVEKAKCLPVAHGPREWSSDPGLSHLLLIVSRSIDAVSNPSSTIIPPNVCFPRDNRQRGKGRVERRREAERIPCFFESIWRMIDEREKRDNPANSHSSSRSSSPVIWERDKVVMSAVIPFIWGPLRRRLPADRRSVSPNLCPARLRFWSASPRCSSPRYLSLPRNPSVLLPIRVPNPLLQRFTSSVCRLVSSGPHTATCLSARVGVACVYVCVCVCMYYASVSVVSYCLCASRTASHNYSTRGVHRVVARALHAPAARFFAYRSRNAPDPRLSSRQWMLVCLIVSRC